MVHGFDDWTPVWGGLVVGKRALPHGRASDWGRNM
jgi:hypothetical protein